MSKSHFTEQSANVNRLAYIGRKPGTQFRDSDAWYTPKSYSWLEMPPICAFAELGEYVFDLLDWLGYDTSDSVRFEAKPDENPDWEIDCWDVYDVLMLLDLTGCLDAPV